MPGWLAIIASRDDQALFVGVMVLVAVVVWAVTRRRHSVEIIVDNGCVTGLRGIAQAQSKRVVSFLEHDVVLNGKVTVLGNRDSNGVLRINFRGSIDEGTRQQIRNYLKLIL